MPAKRILLVEDDTEISALLTQLLKKEGFDVDPVLDGLEAEYIALKNTYDLIILDIMLPGKNGLDLLREIRIHKTTPILMLTAKGDDIDRIVGFEIGADDYLPKPFNPRELIARLNALLRRVYLDTKNQTEKIDNFQHADLNVNFKSRQVWLKNNLVELTATEFNVLSQLIQNANEVITKQELTEQVLGRKLTLYDRAIDMHVSNLRRKIEDTAIKTLRGQGYLYQIH